MKALISGCVCLLAASLFPRPALAVKSAELYTASSFQYGRFEARLRFAAGDGVVSSFFLWKDGSEISGTFWNELDFEKLGADCHLETNAFFGNPASVHVQKHTPEASPCADFHTYAYEWTPEYIAWFLDGVELRRDTGPTATAYAENATQGMQIRFNVWPGDASFGGNFSPSILPVYQHIDWVQYSSYANGAFTLEWRDDFDSPTLASRWLTGSWDSPKNLSTHDARNIGIIDGMAVLALTTDDAVGPGGTPQGGAGGSGGSATAGTPGTTGGTQATGGSAVTAPESSDDGGCTLGPSHGRGVSGLLSIFGVLALSLFGRRRSRVVRGVS